MGYFDIQVNGYLGADFCSSELTLEEMHKACEGMKADGLTGILATLITDHVDSLASKLRRMVQFREEDSLVADMIQGFHVEGPFLNALPGYIGAHPPECVCPATPDDAARIVEAGNGLVRLLTLAPENDANFATTRFLAEQGITVSAGHCDPDLETLQGAIDAGLSMITHLGNGCPVELPRHENFIQRTLSLAEHLWFGFIPDGAHVPFFALKNYLKICGLDRAIMTTDAILAAGLGPGTYELSGAPVEIDDAGVARRPGSPNLAGSTIRAHQVVKNLKESLGFSDEEVRLVFDGNPRKSVGLLH